MTTSLPLLPRPLWLDWGVDSSIAGEDAGLVFVVFSLSLFVYRFCGSSNSMYCLLDWRFSLWRVYFQVRLVSIQALIWWLKLCFSMALRFEVSRCFCLCVLFWLLSVCSIRSDEKITLLSHCRGFPQADWSKFVSVMLLKRISFVDKPLGGISDSVLVNIYLFLIHTSFCFYRVAVKLIMFCSKVAWS